MPPPFIADKIRFHRSKVPLLKKKIYYIISSNKTDLVLSIKSVEKDSKTYFIVSLHQERLRDFDIFLALKEEYGITEKEFEVLCMLKKDISNAEIAEKIKTSESTVKMRLSRLYQKFAVAHKIGLIGVLDDFINA